ncbi:MAG TPA: HD domain-containing protein [Pirellulales bacterium]|jgi:3'-5' exoribonuclease|nr:HD domain-containing protein [Pirellulales bacterium]
MSARLFPIGTLAELVPGEEGDFFALLSAKEQLTTREGKPYFKITFRDAGREVSFPIWNDSAWAIDCRDSWNVGVFFKIRATYKETNFGPQLEIKKIRAVIEADAAEGFNPLMLQRKSRFDAEEMFNDLLGLAKDKIDDKKLRSLVVDLLKNNQDALLTLPAARKNHHAYIGGWLEHTLSVARTVAYLAEKYDEYYSDMQPRLDKNVAIAGAILHDIGKLREYESQPQGAVYTAEGALIGHMLQGRDIVRTAIADRGLSEETMLRLEHVIISHQGRPEWGAPKIPLTPEAMIVHYADDLDAKYAMLYSALRDDKNPGPMTSKKNQLYQQIFRGLE